jgi:hypothetical protein
VTVEASSVTPTDPWPAGITPNVKDVMPASDVRPTNPETFVPDRLAKEKDATGSLNARVHPGMGDALEYVPGPARVATGGTVSYTTDENEAVQ